MPYLHLTYEDIIADLHSAVRQVCDLLQVDADDDVIARIQPRTIRQADQTNAEWMERFRSETG